MITYRYKKEQNRHGGIVFRPAADIILESDIISLEVSMYVDSGADISMVPLSIGKALGFNQDDAEIKELQGIGGEVVPYIIQKVFFNT